MSYYLDEKKLKNKEEELNQRDKAINLDSEWKAVDGMWWYDEITRFSPTGEIKIQPSGIPIKLFINKKTGEYKSFHIGLFESQ